MGRGLAVGECLCVAQSSFPKMGKGLFTLTNLVPNTYLGEYVGEVIAAGEFSRRRESMYDKNDIQ